jgi:hypothetical protein
LAGKRSVSVTDHGTKRDFAQQIKELVDERYPESERIVLVMDNLNTYSPASPLGGVPATGGEEASGQALDPSHARMPKHGSWLNMAEIALSVLACQCLARRVPDAETLKADVADWQDRRNGSEASIDRRFITEDARIKLNRLYPSIQE